MQEPDYAQAIVERVDSRLWILDHLEDVDADFLAIYGIDLEQADALSARRFFALTYRLPAYTGVMQARHEAEREEQQPSDSSTPTRTSSTPAPERGGSEAVEVSLTQFRAMYPGWVSVAQGG
ncbi:hypothetical protein AB0M61_01535 [Streptomyces sp. NPDC051642]|uniref:hypothetical protein n=1 Tax=Streptomyces sp. NPDC051642 TaxID=3154646 RepID=UPI0034223452